MVYLALTPASAVCLTVHPFDVPFNLSLDGCVYLPTYCFYVVELACLAFFPCFNSFYCRMVYFLPFFIYGIFL
jgi:hypothetical protein